MILKEHYRGGGGGGGGGVECSRSVSVSSFISEFVSASFLMHAIITWWLFTHSITSKLNKYFLSYRGLGVGQSANELHWLSDCGVLGYSYSYFINKFGIQLQVKLSSNC